MSKKSKAGEAAAPQKAPASSLIFKKELGLETFLFPIFFFGVFALFAWKMGMTNALNTMMRTAQDLLKNTVLELTAICVIMGAISGLLSEFGFVSLMNRVLQPLMKPVYGLPGAASLGVVTTFLSDNPAILSLAEDQNFRRYFKKYQFPALTNLGTAFGMGLIVCTYMYGCGTVQQPLGMAVLVGLLGAVVGSIVYGLPGAASLGVVTTFLSDNPAILSLAEDQNFRRYFKKYQFPALTNLGTAFGMGLIVCTYMYGCGTVQQPLGMAVLVGLLGAVVGSIVSTRLMLVFTKKLYGTEAPMETSSSVSEVPVGMRQIRDGDVGNRIMGAILDGGHNGVKMGVSIIPGVLVICTLVMMLTMKMPEGGYTGAAYEGIALLPWLANKIEFILKPLFGFTSPDAISVPVTALGAAGAAMTLVPELFANHLIGPNDIAVFTAMCMCWSGYLSTHTSMMDSLNCKELIGKAILSHTIGGLCAGVAAHWIFVLLSAVF